MKKTGTALMLFVGFLAGIVFVYSCGSSGGGGGGGGGSTATAAAMNVGMPISSAPYTITQPGLYYLTGNLTVTSGNAITITSSDVTLDLMGFVITGDGSTGSGVLIDAIENVEVRNGTVRAFNRGIEESVTYTATGCRVIGIRSIGNADTGIYMLKQGSIVKDSVVQGNGSNGINVGYGGVIMGSVALLNGGVGFISSVNPAPGTRIGLLVVNNLSRGNLVGFDFTKGATLVGNTAVHNQQEGIKLLEEAMLSGNTAIGNNQAAGAFPDITPGGTCTTCVFDVNL